MKEDQEFLAKQGRLPVPQAPMIAGLRLKIGVMGGAGEDISQEYLNKSASLGKAIAEQGCVMVAATHTARGSLMAGHAREALAKCCDMTVAECEKMNDPALSACMEACKKAAKDCREMSAHTL